MKEINCERKRYKLFRPYNIYDIDYIKDYQKYKLKIDEIYKFANENNIYIPISLDDFDIFYVEAYSSPSTSYIEVSTSKGSVFTFKREHKIWTK